MNAVNVGDRYMFYKAHDLVIIDLKKNLVYFDNDYVFFL